MSERKESLQTARLFFDGLRFRRGTKFRMRVLWFSAPPALTFSRPCLYKAARDFGFAPTSRGVCVLIQAKSC
ncbi:hypothetical protein CCR94_07525 [Rhodoblastus sphagnicola]|uniref:Uncharacterized protein n=1 Tax=Rhodoblastus sphagnicola TaxID=333368 RepID=A0A2S6NBN9_9HYPH|nr:hypothetical protein CCR94_07525 [Rhodoblastus sphagnicola]